MRGERESGRIGKKKRQYEGRERMCVCVRERERGGEVAKTKKESGRMEE